MSFYCFTLEIKQKLVILLQFCYVYCDHTHKRKICASMASFTRLYERPLGTYNTQSYHLSTGILCLKKYYGLAIVDFVQIMYKGCLL